MAPRMSRLVTFGVLFFAAIAVGLLPPREPQRPRPRPLPRTVDRATRQLRDAVEHLELLTLRDSIIDLVRTGNVPFNDSLAFLIDPGLTLHHDSVIRGLVTPVWRRVSQGRPRVRVVVVVDVDTSAVYRGVEVSGMRTRIDHVVPEVTDGSTCVAGVKLGRVDARRVAEGGSFRPSLVERIRDRTLGPCAYYAAFGMPGPRLRSWLSERQYLPASGTAWVNDPIASPDPRYAGWLDGLHFALVGCAAGDARRCREMRYGLPGEDRLPVRWAGFGVEGVAVGASEYSSWRDPLGPFQRSYFAAMVAHYGREQFERFWTSDAPLDDAFLAATGESLDDWTMRWTRADFGASMRGAKLRPVSVLLSLVIAGVLVGSAGLLSRFRQAV